MDSFGSIETIASIDSIEDALWASYRRPLPFGTFLEPRSRRELKKNRSKKFKDTGGIYKKGFEKIANNGENGT